MTKFTKLNIGEIVVSMEGRAWKKLSKLPQLPAPVISLSDYTLTITDDSGLATSFDILIDNVVRETTTNKSFKLYVIDLAIGTYDVAVIAKASGYSDSPISNTLRYEVEAYVEEENDTGTSVILNSFTEEKNEFGTTIVI